MDWELKGTPWGFGELERDSEHNNNFTTSTTNTNTSTSKTTTLVGSSNGGGDNHNLKQKNRRDNTNCSVDLNLGGLGDFGEVYSMNNHNNNKWNDPRLSMFSTSSSSISSSAATTLSSMKRARGSSSSSSNGGVQIASCLVDGCNADLSKCRDYHRRHKVCEAHSKTPKVLVAGQEQRFCQQCSRFHLLVEFDEVKRSCRKRLDGHNRRRRKPQPDPLSTNSVNLFSYHQGSRILSFANPQVFPSTTVTSPTWHGVVKTEEETIDSNHLQSHYVNNRQNLFPGSFSRTNKEEKQFPFLQVNELGNRMVPEVSVCQQLINNVACSENISSTSRKLFSDGLTRVLDSDCALSLLSSPPTQQRSGISLSHVVQPDSIPMSQPLVPDLEQYNQGLDRYHQSQQGMGGETIGSVLVSQATDAELNCQGLFHMGPNNGNGSSQNGMSQTLPFSWE